MKKTPLVTEVIGAIPNRLQLAGGWIDQPFVSRFNPRPPGSMVVVALEPTFRVMDRFRLRQRHACRGHEVVERPFAKPPAGGIGPRTLRSRETKAKPNRADRRT